MASNSPHKIFVGGLPQSCADEVLANYFEQYGTITDCVVMKDRETGNSRGFGFVSYDSAAAVDMVMAQYDDHRIGDKWIEVKRATPRDQMPPGSSLPPMKGSKGASRGLPPSNGPGGCGGSCTSLTSPMDVRPGDWRCPGCGANVFGTKDTCFKCGEAKPKSGSRGPSPASNGGGGCGAPYGGQPYGSPYGYAAYGAYGPAPSMGMVGPYGPQYAGYAPPGYAAYPMQSPPQAAYGAYKGGSAKGYSPY
eukprot:TRINITY_DN56184_c0_g1_i1.p1 TRINITY_DN56184_c0_g1~~TRINITY_DN56184_c0_g1_i1.p1  ORF type:complete len:249 (-),score=29.56 TRINITY_DN56184_c0_g1_i1:201-947(-)